MKSLGKLALGASLTLWGGVSSATELIVSAAASLTNAFGDVGKAFEQANTGYKVVFNFGGSGQLLQQISRGAPVDVFAAADEETMDRANKQNLIVRTSRMDFAQNRLVLVAPRNSKLSIGSLGELKDEKVKRIAIGNPETVPVGKYAKGALEAAGLFDALQKTFVKTQSVRQSLGYVARGEVDVAFVYATDAAMMPDKVRVLLEVPTQTPIRYPIAAVKGSGKESSALKFVEFVKSDPAQQILAKHGFGAMD